MSPAQQVLVKGVKISSQNLQEIISLIENQFYFLEGRIARVSSMAHDEVELQKVRLTKNCQFLLLILFSVKYRRNDWKPFSHNRYRTKYS